MSNSINQIPDKQNTERFLEYLAASACLYSRSKKLTTIQMILTVPLPLALSVIAILRPERKVWAAFVGILVSVVDVFIFEKFQKNFADVLEAGPDNPKI